MQRCERGAWEPACCKALACLVSRQAATAALPAAHLCRHPAGKSARCRRPAARAGCRPTCTMASQEAGQNAGLKLCQAAEVLPKHPLTPSQLAATGSRGLLQAARAQRPLAAQRAARQQVARPQVATARCVVCNHLRTGRCGGRSARGGRAAELGPGAQPWHAQQRERQGLLLDAPGFARRPPSQPASCPTCGSVQYRVRRLLRVTTHGSASSALLPPAPPLPLCPALLPPPPLPLPLPAG